MNRHIYGLTLFLIIVKIHFLLYWTFLAPVNFFSSPEAVFKSNAQKIETTEFKLRQKSDLKLQNVAVDFKSGAISANVKINSNGDNSVVRRVRIQFFDENKEFVWASDIEDLYFTPQQKSVSLNDCSDQLDFLNPNKNYYARIYEFGISPADDYFNIQTLEGLIAVLQIKSKGGIGCGRGFAVGRRIGG